MTSISVVLNSMPIIKLVRMRRPLIDDESSSILSLRRYRQANSMSKLISVIRRLTNEHERELTLFPPSIIIIYQAFNQLVDYKVT